MLSAKLIFRGVGVVHVVGKITEAQIRQLTAEQRARLILPCQALHAAALRFTWRGRDWEFHAEPEKWFTDFIAGKPCTPDWAEQYL